MLFKIAKADTSAAFHAGLFGADSSDSAMFRQFCLCEDWAGDLSNGVIRLGERATALHGLENSECGLLSMMRCYEPHDRAHILGLFEQAATSSCSFCFSTTILPKGGHRQPVFCIGESSGLEQRQSGSMVGVFVFPRFRLPTAVPLSVQE